MTILCRVIVIDFETLCMYLAYNMQCAKCYSESVHCYVRPISDLMGIQWGERVSYIYRMQDLYRKSHAWNQWNVVIDQSQDTRCSDSQTFGACVLGLK